MEIFIKKVITGTEDKLGNIYETWIQAKTKNGYEIRAEVIKDYNPREFIGKTVDCLILADELHNLQTEKELKIDLINNKFFGEYLGKYDIPQIWNFKDIINYDAIKTLDGIMLIHQIDFRNMDEQEKIYYEMKIEKQLEVGDIISFFPAKFEIYSFRPVEI